ncbi:MAG: DUF6767 domain-containing protein [Dermatophilaceae bacterium]
MCVGWLPPVVLNLCAPSGLGDPWSLCVPGATGPHDCGLVYLVQDDPETA